MTVETKYDKSHHAGATPEARIANRLRNSGGNDADHIAKHGDGPTRTIHNIHNAGHFVQPNTAVNETGPQTQRSHDAAVGQKGGGNG